MKLLISLLLIAIIAYVVYWLSSKIVSKDKKQKRPNRKPFFFAGITALILLGFLGCIIYRSATAPDMQCGETHVATAKPPTTLKSAMDYFEQGNYDYEIGDCSKAIAAYTKSIELNAAYPQAYNNRAYTSM